LCTATEAVGDFYVNTDGRRIACECSRLGDRQKRGAVKILDTVVPIYRRASEEHKVLPMCKIQEPRNR